MKLSEVVRRSISPDPQIKGVTADSRKVKAGFLFAALPGTKVDGRAFAAKAVEAGAAAILAGEPIAGLPVPLITSPDPRRAYALAAAQFWGGQPETCVAVTGTNGKTSVAAFVRQIWASMGFRAASLGTLGRAEDLKSVVHQTAGRSPTVKLRAAPERCNSARCSGVTFSRVTTSPGVTTARSSVNSAACPSLM